MQIPGGSAALTTETSSDRQHTARFPRQCVHAKKACWQLVAAIASTGNMYLHIQVGYLLQLTNTYTYKENMHILPHCYRATVFVEGTVQ